MLTAAHLYGRLSSEQAVILNYEHANLGADWITLRAGGNYRRLEVRSTRNTSSSPVNQVAAGMLQLDFSLFDGRNILTVGGDTSYRGTRGIFGVDADLTYFGGVIQNETRLLDDKSLILNLGARVEQIDVVGGAGGALGEAMGGDVEMTYRNFSPRGALIWRFEEAHDVRLGISTAYRTPPVFDTLVGVNLDIWEEPAPIVRLVAANPGLEPEQYLSGELGYRGDLFEMARVELVTWAQQIHKPQYLDASGAPQVYRNDKDLLQAGVELGVELVLSESARAFFNYAGTTVLTDGMVNRYNGWAPHIVGVGADLGGPEDVNVHVDFFGTFGANQNGDLPAKTLLGIKVGKYVLDGQAEVFLSGRNLLAGLRNDRDLVQGDQTNPIGTTVLVGLSIPNRLAE